ncbi:conserved hypothetical protein [Leishmania infantum JPCM5]|uniref:Uncharacterized protein n=2 Tax=Leishmania infantum TaxID=5671 RepID=A4I344_LEIIN|nr:conserved hypothetical protein [Leishmania infantum JPCM5]CAC9500874.1 hypothetical_protein_-_conserved [Leishmania infantum]CAM69198.1 conserved hypothetical protein [Leishmania infantum JPCM5]SUZ43147.1 hypothetical_protein_-_conserved [Leishmania infantum]|eukprot:XP_001466477.1 conserved hypothetical protein [Leishmania infantum JPCM5]
MASEASMYVDSEEAMPLPERFQQLRHSLHGHWGTTAEADLLRAMQQLHTRLVARSAQTHRRVEELSQRVTAAQVSLANALNALKLLSQHQFVQHRIATEDLQQRQRAVAGSSSEEADGGSSDGTVSPNRALTTSLSTHTTKEAAVRRRMHDYVEMCKESLAEEGVRVPLCPGDVAELAAESPYAHRRLCGLIGTPAFLYDADIGCRRGADMMNAAAVKQRQSPQPQPACLPAAAPPAVVTGVFSASAKPLFPPSAAAKASVPPPHATATGAVAPPAKAPRAQSSVVPPPTAAKSAPAKKERQQALFSSSSSSASSSAASPSAAVTPAAKSSPPLTKRGAAALARPPKSAPAKKGARNLFGSSSSSVRSNSVSSACAEAAKRAAYSPTSSDLSSSDDSRPPPAAARKANNPSPPPLAATTTSPPRAASASSHSSQGSSALSGTPASLLPKSTPASPATGTPALPATPPPAPPPPSSAAPAAYAPPPASPSPPPPPPPAAASAPAAVLPPPPPVFLFDTVSAMGAPAPLPQVAAVQVSVPQSATPPSRTAAGPQPPRRGGKVLSTSSDDDAE